MSERSYHLLEVHLLKTCGIVALILRPQACRATTLDL